VRIIVIILRAPLELTSLQTFPLENGSDSVDEFLQATPGRAKSNQVYESLTWDVQGAGMIRELRVDVHLSLLV
jgi:hypothetical protein